MSILTTSLLGYSATALLGLGYLLGSKKKQKENRLFQQECLEINCILNHAFDGFLVIKNQGKKKKILYSKRLGLLLNLKEKANQLKQILSVFEEESANKLKEHLTLLEKQETPFDIMLKHKVQNFFLQAKGTSVRLSKNEKIDVIWFKDISDIYQKNLALRQENLSFAQQNSHFRRALEVFPQPVCMYNKAGDIEFYNPAYTQKTDENLKINWQTFPLAEDLFFKVGSDVSDYEAVLNSLTEGQKSMQQVFSNLNCAIGIFDATAQLTFFNKAFCEVWKIEALWLKKHPFYDAFLDKLFENDLFPETCEMNSFKKNHKDLFTQLTNVFEEFLLLKEKQIIRCVFVPFIKGSILLIAERKI